MDNWIRTIVAGAFNDLGLQRDQYHILPWSVQDHTAVEIIQEKADVLQRLFFDEKNQFQDFKPEEALRIAKFNINTVLKFGELIQNLPDHDHATVIQLRKDALSILTIMAAFNFYDRDCRAATDAERETIRSITAPQADLDEIFGVDQLKRVSKLITARIGTKYHSNNGLGGTSPQNSFPAEVKKLYDFGNSKTHLNIIKKVIYWSTRPLNETLLIPYVILNSRITKSRVHTKGFIPSTKTFDEYFTQTLIASARTNKFHVAALCIAELKPLGILKYLPEQERLNDLREGLKKIQRYGAALHPCAKEWDLEPQQANQKIIDSLCADLCYAVKLHFPKNPLVRKPIFAKIDLLNLTWKYWNISFKAEMSKEVKKSELNSDSRDNSTSTTASATSILNQVLSRIDKYFETDCMRETSESNNQEEGIPSNAKSQSGEEHRGEVSSSKRNLSDVENGINKKQKQMC